MHRRKFIIGLSTIGLGGCQFSTKTNSLKLELISGTIPGNFIKNFGKLGKVKLVPNINKNYDELVEALNKSSNNVDLVCIGDAWLSNIKSSLQEINLNQITNWNLIPSAWRSVGIIDNKNLAVPFRWGTTVIVYNQAKFKQQNIPPISSWQDLWHPKLKQRISLPDNDREVIGLCLKKAKLSYNENIINSEIQAELSNLHQQTLTYSSNSYVQSLVNEDTWAAVGWSSDVTEIVKRYPKLKVIHPEEGTALWFDCWVIPKDLTDNVLVYQWLNFCLEPANSHLITLLTNGNGITDRDQTLTDEYLDRCEPILPLPNEIAQKYQKIWQELRQKT